MITDYRFFEYHLSWFKSLHTQNGPNWSPNSLINLIIRQLLSTVSNDYLNQWFENREFLWPGIHLPSPSDDRDMLSSYQYTNRLIERLYLPMCVWETPPRSLVKTWTKRSWKQDPKGRWWRVNKPWNYTLSRWLQSTTMFF